MKIASLICTYLYGTLAIIKTAVEGYIGLAKGILKRLDSAAQAAITTCRFVIDTAISTTVNLVKEYEKELIDMLYDSIFGTDKTVWCNRLWKCLALLNELMDPESWLFKHLKKWLDKKCVSDATKKLLENIQGIVSDFQQFQQTVCSAGFSLEFGISYIKQFLEWCKEQVEVYLKWCERQIKRLKLMVESYLNQLIDWGVLDYLDKLLSFFTCAFDDSMSCSEIATASNFYNDALAKLKLQKDGDGYNISSEYRNSIYGTLEATKNQLSNLKMFASEAADKCVDPAKLAKANAAFNLSKELLPVNDDGEVSWTKIKKGKFQSCKLWKDINRSYDELMESIQGLYPDRNLKDLENGMKIDDEGMIWYKDGCKLNPLGFCEGTPVDVMMSTDINNNVMFSGGHIYTVTGAAYEVINNPESDIAQECIEAHNFIDSWNNNMNGVKKYNQPVI